MIRPKTCEIGICVPIITHEIAPRAFGLVAFLFNTEDTEETQRLTEVS